MRMKTLLTITTLVFTVMFSSTSFGGWTKVDENMDTGTIFYVDFERIRKVDGYVYFWDLSDLLKPNRFGRLSVKHYQQGDCKLFRFKILTLVHHNQPMGLDTGKTSNQKNPEWMYPPPNSSGEDILKSVCSR